MKKFFTLIAAVAMAASVNAQVESVTFNASSSIASAGEQTFTTENVTMVNGKDIDTGGWSLKKVDTSKGEVSPSGFDCYIVAKNNPKADPEPGSGSGYKPTNKALPQSGGYVTLVCKKAGELEMGIKLGSNKNIYVTDAEGNSLDIFTIKDSNTGEVVTLTDENKLPSSYATPGFLCGTLTFKAEANETYYVFAVGSKLSYFGYKFTPATSTGISSVEKEVSAKSGKTFNLAGQEVSSSYKGVVIKDGKKFVQ